MGLLVVLVVSAAALLPGTFSLPAIDRDEARFAQASRQMLEATDLQGWIVPRVGERPRLNKPPLIYWLQAGGAWVASSNDATKDAIWMYRVPSILAALVTASIVWSIGRRMFDSTTALVAGVLIGTCPLVVFDAHMARADEVLLAVTTAAQAMLWWCWRERDRTGGLPFAATALFWLFVGLGAMTKGPITPFVCGATALTLAFLEGRWRWLWALRPWLGVLIVGAVVVPWVIALVQSMGWDAVQTFFDEEVVRRASSGVEGHTGPPGYHLVLMTVLFWPGSLLATAGVVFAIKRVWSEGNAASTDLFLLAWLLPSWLAFELAGTKLPHYVLPLYPALALLLARAFMVGVERLPNAKGALAEVGFALWVLLGLVLAATPLALLWIVESTPSPGVVVVSALGSAATAVLIGGAYVWLRKGKMLRTVGWSVAAVVLCQMLLLGVVLPSLGDIWISSRLMAIVEEDAGVGPAEALFPPLASQGFGEDSLVYESRAKVVMTKDAAAFLLGHPDGYAIVLKGDAASIEHATNAVRIGSVRGFDYSDGETYELCVLRARAK